MQYRIQLYTSFYINFNEIGLKGRKEVSLSDGQALHNIISVRIVLPDNDSQTAPK